MIKYVLLLAMTVLSNEAMAVSILDYNYAAVAPAKAYNIYIVYGKSKPHKRVLPLKEHQQTSFKDGKNKVYYVVNNDKVEERTIFDGFKVNFRSVSSRKNKFVQMVYDYNEVTGYVRDETNFAALKNGRPAAILISKVPVLSKDSGRTYLNVPIGAPVDIKSGSFRLRVLIKEAR